MPQLSGLLETSLYVEDLERSSRFYLTLFGFESLFADTRLHALSVTGGARASTFQEARLS